jgi:predicted acyltransferase (DUF342 family)
MGNITTKNAEGNLIIDGKIEAQNIEAKQKVIGNQVEATDLLKGKDITADENIIGQNIELTQGDNKFQGPIYTKGVYFYDNTTKEYKLFLDENGLFVNKPDVNFDEITAPAGDYSFKKTISVKNANDEVKASITNDGTATFASTTTDDLTLNGALNVTSDELSTIKNLTVASDFTSDGNATFNQPIVASGGISSINNIEGSNLVITGGKDLTFSDTATVGNLIATRGIDARSNLIQTLGDMEAKKITLTERVDAPTVVATGAIDGGSVVSRGSILGKSLDTQGGNIAGGSLKLGTNNWQFVENSKGSLCIKRGDQGISCINDQGNLVDYEN